MSCPVCVRENGKGWVKADEDRVWMGDEGCTYVIGE